MYDDDPAYRELRAVIEEELAAQVGARRLENPDGVGVNADLIAHVVWRVFEVRAATPVKNSAPTWIMWI
jgi:hypothetical protein